MVLGLGAALFVSVQPAWLGISPGSEEQQLAWWMIAGFCTLLVLILAAYLWIGRSLGRDRYRLETRHSAPAEPEALMPEAASEPDALAGLQEHLRTELGPLWRSKVRLLLVFGEPAEVEAIAPGLEGAGWLESNGDVLLWGGALLGEQNTRRWRALTSLRAASPLDGVVWALNEAQCRDAQGLGHGAHRLRELARQLRWQAPLYLWQVCQSDWEQTTRERQSVCCLLPVKASVEQIESSLRQLVRPLHAQGLGQMAKVPAHDFLLRLSRDLERDGITQWRDALAPSLIHFAKGMPLRGLVFSPPQPRSAVEGMQHAWWPNADWQAVREDRQATGRVLGWTWGRGAQVSLLGLAGLAVLAVLVSFAGNRSQVATAQSAVAVLQHGGEIDDQLAALSDLTRTMAQLQTRQAQGVPWYLGFGLSQNDALLAALWAPYTQANSRLLRDEAARTLVSELRAFAALPPSAQQQAERTQAAHGQLKAYLMMAHPERANAEFLAKVLATTEQVRSPALWRFYAQNLPAHADWKIEPDAEIVAQARQILLAQLGQRSGVETLYQQVLDAARNQYVDLSLRSMVGETDAVRLFDTSLSVPGVFTRQAWEGSIRQSIEAIAAARREEIDWVLSDTPQDIASELQPHVLKAQLTERYFQQFGEAWLGFINSVRWRRAESFEEAIGQLTLLADRRQSPLLALLNTLAYQGDSGNAHGAAEQALTTPAPLEAIFGPMQALLDKRAAAQGADERPSVQSFLNRVDRLRMTLQQVANAPDPQARGYALGQAVLQGRTLGDQDARDYGKRITQSLGSQYALFGQNLFVLPLEQAWSDVLQPIAQRLNLQWQRDIVAHWAREFEGSYPFAKDGADASLPALGRMLRVDTGVIDQFIRDQLGGILRKDGPRWVSTGDNQGLPFNPAFLTALNQLGEVREALYGDGWGIPFELQAKPVRDVVETSLILDGTRLDYFNQTESWQAFRWPGPYDHPGASLRWSGVKSGSRLFGDYLGTWGVVRLLEHAQVTALDSRGIQSRLVLTTPDGLPLTWHLRSKTPNGPLAMLRLRGFRLPTTVFQVNAARPDSASTLETP
ncbi:type VI secretion system protein ImpL [Pseudomonas delhiensis]|uniref:Type VI secretion system protein ImpL n=1 Tax=Pseudomonas delhiensis TaxID=366289 RepID=A0A239JZ45_9PSED|nr:type VI secretion system protein ImpL [Pseudomonas delhiensis]SNT10693.1 type VI secretion system protein ImpL [Pseudomonas delhiensis]